MKRLLVIGALSVVLGGIGVIQARPAMAQEEKPHSGFVACIGQLLNLPGLDIPEDTILIGFGVTDDFQCPSQGRFT